VEQQRRPGESITIIPIILTSDKTLLGGGSGTAVAWPIYMSVGNVTGYRRWHPDNRSTRLVGMFPEPAGAKGYLPILMW
jgi:hypothetical protein